MVIPTNRPILSRIRARNGAPLTPVTWPFRGTGALYLRPADRITLCICGERIRGTHLSSYSPLVYLTYSWMDVFRVLVAQTHLYDDPMQPFYDMLSPELFNDMKDYFYLSMLRVQGLTSMDTRLTSLVVPITEIPYLVRALGFYASDFEVSFRARFSFAVWRLLIFAVYKKPAIIKKKSDNNFSTF